MAKDGKHHGGHHSGGHSGGMMEGGEGMSPRKAIASGKGGEGFGVESFEAMQGHTGVHPDHAAKTGENHLEDHERGIGNPVHAHGHPKGHHHPQQAAPDHGPTHPGGHGMHDGYKHAI